jgi:predicted Zn-dependent protease
MTVLAHLLLLASSVDIAQSLLRAGKVEEARQAVQAVLKESPHSVAALTLAGRIDMARNDFDSARTHFTRAAELAPASAPTQFLLGFFHYVDNDFKKAKPPLEIARKLAPSDSRTALFLALTHEGLAEIDTAEILFRESLRKPAVEAHIAYARMLFANGRHDEAQAQITRALTLDNQSREAFYEQARLDLEKGNLAGAIHNALRSLQAQGDGATPRQIHFLLSRAYGRAGDAAKASEHRQKFEAIPPRLIR